MAANEQDREDLMREAIGLSPRAEISSPAFPENVVFGFKQQGGLSIYFGADPVYQFNSTGELRRAFVGGDLVKAEAGRLVVLHRDRSAREVTLWSTELTHEQAAATIARMNDRLTLLIGVIERGESHLVAEVPHGADAMKRLKEFLSSVTSRPMIAQQPNST